MTPAEIIARAYDREQAAQMGEPDPWGNGTDHPEWGDSLACAQSAIDALQAAGIRLIPEGEYDPVTIEAAAKVAEEEGKSLPNSIAIPATAGHIAAAIRALADGGGSE